VPTLSVLIADDHPLVAEGLIMILRDQPDLTCIGVATNGQEAVEMAVKMRPDILLLDINMPVLNGIEACRQLKKVCPDTRIIALSMVSEISLVRNMIRSGANGYLLKNAGKDEVLEAIRTVQDGQTYFTREIMDLLTGVSATPKRDEYTLFPRLSRRELQILSCILDEKTTAEIAEELFIGFGTVETHRRNMLQKLNVKNTAGLVRVALEYDLLGRQNPPTQT
jgi:DNA-binding NarL/FixJ family response regulator